MVNQIPTVVHCKLSDYDVYVGRGRDPKRPDIVSPWGNPFSHKAVSAAHYKVATVEEAVACHREWLNSRRDLIDLIRRRLRGMTLGCWCIRPGVDPRSCLCHGWTLFDIANS